MRFLDKHSAREKHLRRLEREVHRLCQARADTPVIPLEHPFQRGWVKTYALADGIGNRPDAQIFRTILATVNRRVWARDRSFVSRAGHPIELHPGLLRVKEWDKLAWPASHLRFFALGVWRAEDAQFWWLRRRGWVHGYKLVQRWWLREDVQPFLITHRRVDLPDVKSRLAEIETFMRHTHGWDKLGRLHGQTDWWRIHHLPRRELRAAEHLAEGQRNSIEQT